MRVVLDTGAVRSIIHNDTPSVNTDLLAAQRPGIVASIGEPAFAEIVAVVHEQRIGWNDWRGVIARLDSILDPNLPILPGRRELAEYVADQLPADRIVHIQAGWQHIVESLTPESLSRISSYQDSTGNERRLTGTFRAVQPIRSAVHQEWIGIVRRMQEILQGKGVSNERIEEIVRNGFETIPGHSLDCLDAAVRFLSRSIALSVNGGRTPYNPEANVNDAFDFELLYSLALPDSIICTTDTRLMNIVTATGSPQAGRIIGVDELNRRLSDNSLSMLLP